MDKVANVRLSNRVIWALEDIGAHTIHALAVWEKALQRAELKCADPALLIALSKIKNDLADIRLLALTARRLNLAITIANITELLSHTGPHFTLTAADVPGLLKEVSN